MSFGKSCNKCTSVTVAVTNNVFKIHPRNLLIPSGHLVEGDFAGSLVASAPTPAVEPLFDAVRRCACNFALHV
jgi:hypothetical protein